MKAVVKNSYLLIAVLVAAVSAGLALPAAAAAAAYTIASDGTGCAAIGVWDAGASTCRLSQNITVGAGQDAIEIIGDNLILDGAGFTLSGGYAGGASDGSDGVFVNGRTNVSVKNLNIDHFTSGIRYFGTTNGYIDSNWISYCLTGLYLTQSSNSNDLAFNTSANNVGEGVYIWNSNSNMVATNNFMDNTGDNAWVGGTSSGNSFTLFGIYGNYWDDWDSVSPPENCVNNSPFNEVCDNSYAFTGGNDAAPRVLRFSIARYDWGWYDDIGGRNWVLLANRADSFADTVADLKIGGGFMTAPSLSGFGPGYLPQNSVVGQEYPGLMSGPVTASVRGQDTWTVASQRVLWPRGGNSLEEVPGNMVLDYRYYWTWYDMASPGFRNWILVSNPNSYQIHFSVRIGDVASVADEILPAGGSESLTFPGVMGGPVRVTAWNDSGDPAYIMASQRVLTNNNTAFNEVPGQATFQLASDSVWPWYDMTGTTKDWVLIANPTMSGDPSTNDIYYQVYIANSLVASGGPILPGGSATPWFPGTIGGPVEVLTYSDPAFSIPAEAITSQRILWGPSFEEVPGINKVGLNFSYDWTWYDQMSLGVSNWVLVTNPSATDTITATVSFTDQATGIPQSLANDIAPGAYWGPYFPGKMGGPVHVQAVVQGGNWGNFGDRRAMIASQRVLWNGYFNEVGGQ